MAEQYKLTYFNIRGLAEPIRFILAMAGVPYEDNRIERDAWAELKPKTKWGQLPYLTINGEIELAQSAAIGRYLAKKYKLAGEDDLEQAKADEIIDALSDLRSEWRKWFSQADEAKKEELKKELVETISPRFFNKLTSIKEANDGEWLVGKNVTWADIHVAVTLEFFESTADPEVLTKFPVLKALKEAVWSLPQIKEWIEKRPQTAM